MVILGIRRRRLTAHAGGTGQKVMKMVVAWQLA